MDEHDGWLALIAVIGFVGIVCVPLYLAVHSQDINFCPAVCDDCVDKVILTPQDDVTACQPVWNILLGGESPEFIGLLENHICYLDWYLRVNSSYPEGFHFFNETGTCGTLEKWVSINENHFIIRPETYLYTYQVQNEVQFDYCIQEYYKEHFGGDV